jgi:elongation of very long chain fatty acids protein 4
MHYSFINSNDFAKIMISLPMIGRIFMIYYLSVLLLIQYMQNKTPYSLNSFMKIYNFAQIIANIYMLNGLVNITKQNIFAINLPYTNNTEYYVYIHYLSKYLDYFDTLFIILRGKTKQQLTFLHIYHHSSIAVVWGYLLNIGHGNGTAAFGCLINSFIHLIMYSHYLYTSFGYTNPYKKYITQLQLTQFVLCIIHFMLVYFYDTTYPKELSWIQFFYHIKMIILFTNFYMKSYKTIKSA